MNATNPNTITTAAPAGVIPAARTAQNITVEQRATMNSSRRTGQGAAAPSQPSTTRAAATPPATAAAPSEGQPAAQPGTEPNSTPAAATPAPAAAPVVTPAAALANAAGGAAGGAGVPPVSVPPGVAPEEGNAQSAPPEAGHNPPEAGATLNGDAPAWLEQVLAGDNTAVPVAIKQMGKRIGELTYRLRIAEDALAATGGPTAPASSPGGEDTGEGGPQADRAARPNVQTPPAPQAEFQQVQAQLDHEWTIVAWCQKNRDGGTVKTKDGSINEFSAEQVADQLVASQRKIQDLSQTATRLEETHRAQFTATRNRSMEEAARKYPWMADPQRAAPEAKEAAAYIDANPHVLRDPQWPLVVGRYVTGLFAERKAPNGTATPPVAAPLQRPRATGAPAPVPGAPPSQAPRVDPKRAELAQLEDEFRKTGSVKIKQKIFALQRQMPAGVAA